MVQRTAARFGRVLTGPEVVLSMYAALRAMPAGPCLSVVPGEIAMRYEQGQDTQVQCVADQHPSAGIFNVLSTRSRVRCTTRWSRSCAIFNFDW